MHRCSCCVPKLASMVLLHVYVAWCWTSKLHVTEGRLAVFGCRAIAPLGPDTFDFARLRLRPRPLHPLHLRYPPHLTRPAVIFLALSSAQPYSAGAVHSLRSTIPPPRQRDITLDPHHSVCRSCRHPTVSTRRLPVPAHHPCELHKASDAHQAWRLRSNPTRSGA